MSSVRHRGAAFVEDAVDLIRAGVAIVGAVYDPESKATSEPIGRLLCPWCRTVVLVTVIAGDHAETGQIAGGPFPTAACQPSFLITGLWEKAKARAASTLGDGRG